MTRTAMGRICLALVAGATPIAFVASPVAAASPAPGTGIIGACNMLLDPTMGTGPMFKDTLHGDGANGNAGMFGAVASAGDPTCSSFGG